MLSSTLVRFCTWLADADWLLAKLVDAVCPQSVIDELETHAPGRWAAWQGQGWISSSALTVPAQTQSLEFQVDGLLDRGEADALALARQCGIEWLLTDDAAARFLASSLGFSVRGSLGLVLEAARLRVLTHDEVKTILAALRDSSLWISARIYSEALHLLSEIAENEIFLPGDRRER